MLKATLRYALLLLSLLVLVVVPVAAQDAEMTPEATEEPLPPPEAVEFARGLYRINPEVSEARFIIDELLRGQPTRVVGVTSDVAADFIVDILAPVNSQVGGVAINARTLVTDNSFRNQALRGRILLSSQDDYEFIQFTPTLLEGLPEEDVMTNTRYTFSVNGDLTIIDTTLPVTFETTVYLAEGGEQLVGTATTTVLYADYDITIPDVPSVSDISDEVILEIDFIADLVESQES